MLLMDPPPLQHILSLIFSGLQHTTVIVTVFAFSSYIWSRISLVHKSHHQISTQTNNRLELNDQLTNYVAIQYYYMDKMVNTIYIK
ncbi:hypothetical protein CRYUN_Cryun31cG0002200 [Craigia yunnanensis]